MCNDSAEQTLKLSRGFMLGVDNEIADKRVKFILSEISSISINWLPFRAIPARETFAQQKCTERDTPPSQVEVEAACAQTETPEHMNLIPREIHTERPLAYITLLFRPHT